MGMLRGWVCGGGEWGGRESEEGEQGGDEGVSAGASDGWQRAVVGSLRQADPPAPVES